MALYKRLGDLLLAAGTISEEELERGLELQKGTKDRLGTVLISNNIITEWELIEALQMQLGIDFIDLTKVNIPTSMAQLLPKHLAKQYQVIPVKSEKDEVYIAMADPLNFIAIEEVRKAVKKKIIPMIATATAIDHSITILYGNEGAALAIEEMRREASASAEVATPETGAFVANQLGDDGVNNAPTIRLVNSIIERAVTERASDIHLEPRDDGLHVRMRIDGLLRSILIVPKELQNSVISRLKIMAEVNVSERRIPQDGRFNVRIKEKDIDVRVSTLPTVYGEKIVTRLLDKSGGMLTKEMIGLSGKDLQKYEQMIKCHNGVILIVGPTGSGKSSTMYTMVRELNNDDVNLVTLEDPVEYNIDGVNQVQINEKTGMTFAGGLRSILRQDPDIIAVGEIRDGETAEISMRAAITGHVVLSTIHTNDALGTIDRLVDMGVPAYLISAALKGVISQRLVRRICTRCKTSYEAGADDLENLGIKDGKPRIFYKGKGCPDCFDTGYRGRIAVFEMLPITKEIRSIIAGQGSREQLEKLLKMSDIGYVSLMENGIRLVEEGITTVDEVMRVVNEQD